MKMVKSTGLVPVKFLRANGPYSEGQIAGLDPAMVKRLKAGKTAVIEEVAAEKGVETVTVDDESLQAVPETPALGGDRHLPPLASDRLPGRNRLSETEILTPSAAPEAPDSPKAAEDSDKATVDDPEAHDDKTPATPPAPPLPTRKTK
ncbi:hypothetical protein [Mangrovibrevibacter kandeliae]|uniref:hypothetical protein n=1 Tax=Mangrovibrevibacter kandeliae TaxID=2968473 RepID=UPI0021177F70|nr:hypothetical protein [Aurantimonas sp. CSK15Z-1]MCQ8781715.1 hypothetical protein [Aurantimonas sp. CSK15Z-1]